VHLLNVFCDLKKGDSGGSLYVLDTVNNKSKYVSSGIVSYGNGCALPNYPGYEIKKKLKTISLIFYLNKLNEIIYSIYTRVSYFMDWIIYQKWL
jgi:secreted trypsin-like serine protease